MMHWFGCDPIILVGCDCMMVPGEGKEMHGNVFKDKQARLVETSRRREVVVNGQKIVSTKRLLQFVDEFEGWERRLVKTKIYKMGNFGAVDIPHVDFPELYTDMHPERKK